MLDFENFALECDGGARINTMSGFFAATAGGRSGMPVAQPFADGRLLHQDALMQRLTDLHVRRQGFFDRHYHASIPYRLEEEMRMTYAVFTYAMQRATPLLLYTMGTAEGTMARVLAELACGKIRTLSCSPTAENRDSFFAYGKPENAEFFLGPFHHLTPQRRATDPALAQFRAGFDMVLEDTNFQMYSPNRDAQIEFLAQHLVDDGILLLVEKFTTRSDADYLRREQQKDLGFKARYFSVEDVAAKKQTILGTMHDNEVTLTTMAEVLYRHFTHCVVIWNSGNFYGLGASNSWENLGRYLSGMPAPAIPREYVYAPPLLETGLSGWPLSAAASAYA